MKYKILTKILIAFFLITSLVNAGNLIDFENNFDNWEKLTIKIKEENVLNDIKYKEVKDLNISLDLYYPFFSIEEEYPVIIFIHGGGFIIGRKSDVYRFSEIFDSFLEEGWAVLSIDYRLLNRRVTFPDNLEDVKNAVDWVYNNADQYELDIDKIGLWGSSAGGNLALMTALSYSRVDNASVRDNNNAEMSNQDKNLYGNSYNEGTPFDFVISFAGPTDLLSENLSIQKRISEFIIGNEVSDDLLRQASPLHNLQGDVALPPTLIIHGRNDMIVPYAQSEVFYERIKEINNECKLISLNSGHTLSPSFHAGLRKHIDDILNFIKKYF